MRLWSLHPSYLDAKGLVACWREALLAKAVLQGKTRGYRQHPQLERFRAHTHPLQAINSYLHAVCDEAEARSYRFTRHKAGRRAMAPQMRVTAGQLQFERAHLERKLRVCDPAALEKLNHVRNVKPHPLFRKVRGDVAPWEKQD